MMPKLPPDPVFTFHGSMKSIGCIYFNSATSHLYCGSDSVIHVWDMLVFKELGTINIGETSCISIHHNQHFVTQQRDGSVKIWLEVSMTKWSILNILQTDHQAYCKMLHFSSILITPIRDSSIQVYDLNHSKGKIIVEREKSGLIMCLTFTERLHALIACYENGEIILSDVNGNLLSLQSFSKDCPMAIDFNDCCSCGIVGTSGSSLIKFNLVDKYKIVEAGRITLKDPGVGSVAIREDGALFAIGTWGGIIKYYSMKKLKLLAVLNQNLAISIDSLYFTRSNFKYANHLIAASRDGQVTYWNLYANDFANKS